jgi:hypothetical protein
MYSILVFTTMPLGKIYVVDSEPILKAQVQQRRLFSKGLHNFK